MCKIVALTLSPSGSVSFCKCCNKYYLEYGNIQMKISKEEMKQMKTTLESIDLNYWFSDSASKGFDTEKIYIDIRPTAVRLRFNKQEFIQLLQLLDTTVEFVEGIASKVENKWHRN